MDFAHDALPDGPRKRAGRDATIHRSGGLTYVKYGGDFIERLPMTLATSSSSSSGALPTPSTSSAPL